MGYLGHAVGTDEIDAVAVGAHPLASAAVDDDARDVDAIEQIVGIVGAVVAGHLDLLENGRLRGYLAGRESQRAHIGAYPHLMVLVFGHAVHVFHIDSGAVLVDEGGIAVDGVARGLVAEEAGLLPAVVDKPHEAAAVEGDVAQVGQRLQRLLVE